jgi:hypothetical protein
MPFDAVGFPSGSVAAAPGASPRSLRGVWRGFRDRLRDASGRSHPVATAALLRAARSLIADEASWMQGAYEWDGRRCAMGALQAAGRTSWRAERRDAAAALLEVARLHGHHSVESLNDSVSHGEMLAMFDAAIVRAELGWRRGFQG